MKKTTTFFIASALCFSTLTTKAGDDNLFTGKKVELKSLMSSKRSSDGANAKGVIQIGLGWGATLGGAHDVLTTPLTSTTDAGIGLTSNLGVRVQYGLAKLFSVGLFARRENAVYVPTTDNTGNGNGYAIGTQGFGFGIEGKVYPINKEKFALYVAPRVGFSTSKTRFYDDYSDLTGKANGLNYGLVAGFNWYWAKFIGMSVDLGYSGASLNGKFNDASLKDYKFNLKNGGFFFGIGLITKFGG
jgi:hypothetical protein